MEQAFINLVIASGSDAGTRVRVNVADQETTYPYCIIERVDTDFQHYIGGFGGPSIATFRVRTHSKKSPKESYDVAVTVRDSITGFSGIQDGITVHHILCTDQLGVYRHDKAGREQGTWTTEVEYEAAYEEP